MTSKTNRSQNKTALVVCTMTFFVGAFLLLGCNPMQLGGLGEFSIVSSSSNDDEEAPAEDETKKENENDLLKDMEKPLFALFVTGRQYGLSLIHI